MTFKGSFNILNWERGLEHLRRRGLVRGDKELRPGDGAGPLR